MTTLVVGTDEAGYGPNLGPLVVAATAWRVAAAPAAAEAALAHAAAALADAEGPLWDDSKRLFRGGNLAPLERGVHAAVRLVTGGPPADWRALAAACGIVAAADAAPDAAARAGLALPRRADVAACAARAEQAGVRLAAGGVGLVALRCRVIEPAEFNDLLDRGLSKADVLSAATLEIAAALAADAGGPALVWCDRHGGRRRYAPLVARAFGAVLVRPLEETAARSAYALGADGSRIEFCVGGEARLPVALASMTAKYVRELAMEAFNAHWGARRPGLGATAGYPVDAARWWREAEETVRAAGVERRRVWRRS